MLGVNVKSARFSTLEKYSKRFLTSSSIAVIRLVGGVLLVALFALVPNRVSAYNMNFTSRDETYNGYFRSDVYSSCRFSPLDVRWHSDYFVPNSYLGSTLNDSGSNCGYRIVNGNIGFYSNSSNGYYQSNVSSGVLTNSTTLHSVGNYDPATTWSVTDRRDRGQNFRAVNKHISMYVGSSYGRSDLVIPARQFSNQKTFFFLRVEPDSAFDIALTASISDSIIHVFNGDTELTGDTAVNEIKYFKDMTDQTIVKVCGDATNYFPSISNWDFAHNTDSCYIIGSFYNNAYTFYISELVFSPAPTKSYYLYNDDTQLTDNYYTDWLSYNSETFAQSATSGNSVYNGMWYKNYYFYSATCADSSECESWADMESHNIGVNNGNDPNWTPSDDTGSSGYMWWFDVFKFGIVFPFTNFFNAFTDSNACVSVPIIGGMLHNPNAQYCSWWSADIRSVLTPVFSIFSIMIIFGFIMSFLKGHSDPIASPTSGGKGVWNYKENGKWKYGGEV